MEVFEQSLRQNFWELAPSLVRKVKMVNTSQGKTTGPFVQDNIGWNDNTADGCPLSWPEHVITYLHIF